MTDPYELTVNHERAMWWLAYILLSESDYDRPLQADDLGEYLKANAGIHYGLEYIRTLLRVMKEHDAPVDSRPRRGYWWVNAQPEGDSGSTS